MLFREVEYTDVAEADARAVAAETDVSLLVEHARVVPVVDGVRVVVAAVRGYVVSLAGFAQIAVQDYFTVESHGDVVSDNLYLFLVPCPERLVHDPLGRNDAVCGTMYLIYVQVLVDRVVMVENLAFAHSVVGCIHIFRSTDTYAVVDSRSLEAEFETEYEVAVLFLRIEIVGIAVVGSHIDGAVDERISPQVSCPL